jgi:hypothetical protein
MDSLGIPQLIVLFFGVLFAWWKFRQPGNPFSQ